MLDVDHRPSEILFQYLLRVCTNRHIYQINIPRILKGSIQRHKPRLRLLILVEITWKNTKVHFLIICNCLNQISRSPLFKVAYLTKSFNSSKPFFSRISWGSVIWFQVRYWDKRSFHMNQIRPGYRFINSRS